MRASIDTNSPSKWVFYATVLNAGEFVIKPSSKFSRLAIRYPEFLAFIGYFAYRGDNRRRPRGKHFFQCATSACANDLINGNQPLRNVESPTPGKLECRISRDSRQNGAFKGRSNKLIVNQEENIACTDLFYVLKFVCIKP